MIEDLSQSISCELSKSILLILGIDWLLLFLQDGMTVHHIDVEMLHYAELHLLSCC